MVLKKGSLVVIYLKKYGRRESFRNRDRENIGEIRVGRTDNKGILMK